MVKPPARILIVRNDKLGDFMLAYPSFIHLKRALPGSQVVALVPAYTAEIARACPGIDEVLIDPGPSNGATGVARLIRTLRDARLEAVITLFSTTRVGLACRAAGIPYRLAPATKIAQLFYNHRERQRRSRSEKPEAIYNLDLVDRFLSDQGIAPPARPAPPYLRFEASATADLRRAFCRRHGLEETSRLVFIHPGSGGSANSLSVEQFARLGRALRPERNLGFVITAGPGEGETATRLADALQPLPRAVFVSTQGLVSFAQHLQFADLFVSGSTGPLHIAGALDVPTAAFYTRRRSATALRWQTLNSEDRRLAFEPPADAHETDMSTVDTEHAARVISERFLR